VGTRKPDGYGFGQNFKPVMGTGFLMGVNIFHGYKFGIAKPDGFVPVAISTRDVLAMQVSTIASESAFSVGDRVLDPFRTRLDPTIVEALVCTKDWIARARKGYIEVTYIYLQFN
jgi:hypothetical protein